MVFSIGQTAENMKEAGKMVNNTVSALTLLQAARQNKANGRMVRDYTGLQAITVKNNEHISFRFVTLYSITYQNLKLIFLFCFDFSSSNI